MASPKLVGDLPAPSPLDLRGRGVGDQAHAIAMPGQRYWVCMSVPAAAVTLPTESEECNAGTARLLGGLAFGML